MLQIDADGGKGRQHATGAATEGGGERAFQPDLQSCPVEDPAGYILKHRRADELLMQKSLNPKMRAMRMKSSLSLGESLSGMLSLVSAIFFFYLAYVSRSGRFALLAGGIIAATGAVSSLRLVPSFLIGALTVIYACFSFYFAYAAHSDRLLWVTIGLLTAITAALSFRSQPQSAN